MRGARSGKVGRQFADRAAEKALDVAEHVDFVRRDDVQHHAVLVVTGRAGETLRTGFTRVRKKKDVAGALQVQLSLERKKKGTYRCT